MNNTYTIDKPGTYVFDEDILWPNHIIIAANDVILNGDNHTIRQSNTSIKKCFGVKIKPGVKNVQILNLNLENLSGGGIWLQGNNSNITIKRVKVRNCGYSGLTSLDSNSLIIHDPKIQKIPTAYSFGLLLDGGHNRPIKDIQIIECDFFETGIFESKYEIASSAIIVYQAENILIKDCSVDGCVGIITAFGITLVAISNIVLDDVIISDIYSSRRAEGLFVHDIGANLHNVIPTSIISNINATDFRQRLIDHGNRDYNAIECQKRINPMVKHPKVTALHLKGVIPNHQENEKLLFEEHIWRELRTLGRLVSYHSHERSTTSAMYAKWVEEFCDKMLGVKVKVMGGFANLYLNGEIPLSAHRDAFGKWIFGLSFGETRTLEFFADSDPDDITSFELSGGDIFVFSPEINHTHMHRMRPEPERKGRRINVTYFLDVLPGEDPNKLLRLPKSIE